MFPLPLPRSPASASAPVFSLPPGDGRDGQIRTDDFLLPKQALYQAELRPVTVSGGLRMEFPGMQALVCFDAAIVILPGIIRHPRSLIPVMEFPQLVDAHYRGLFQFALSLARSEPDAADLTQETFLRWAEKGTQLRDVSKAKSWLYTTLYRLFLGRQRHVTRFPHDELSEAESRLPAVDADAVRQMEGAEVMAALQEIDEVFRAPLVLFYLEEHSYQEIAEILDVPPGTVMSRLWRGKALLRARLEESARGSSQRDRRVVPMKPVKKKEA